MRLEIEGHGLMQKVGAEPGKSPATTSWYEETQPAFSHHADYLNRLRKLRQDLIDHEHRKLTNALEKFRLKDKESTFYFGKRIPGRPVFKLHAHNALPSRSNTQTAERTWRSRKEEQPHLETVKGTQLIEPQENPEENIVTPRVTFDRSEIDSTVRENLQRLLQQHPSCSIPTIGRRSLRQFTDENVSTASKNNESSQKSPRGLCVQRSLTHYKFPLAAGARERNKHFTQPDADELNISPKSIKFQRTGRDLSETRFERSSNNSYDIFYVPSTPDTEATNRSRKRCQGFKQNENKCSRSSSDLSYLPQVSGLGSPRKRIVVDMPDIVLYPASPDVPKITPSKGGQLSKTLKQNQLREKEISNLLEDVKEICNLTHSLEKNIVHKGQ